MKIFSACALVTLLVSVTVSPTKVTASVPHDNVNDKGEIVPTNIMIESDAEGLPDSHGIDKEGSDPGLNHGLSCSMSGECSSGRCENYKCAGKVEDGHSCPNGNRYLCKSDYCTCGICGNKHPNGKKCYTNDNCSSGWCESRREGSITLNCKGTCKAKRENGQWCHNEDVNSCKNSNQCTCRKCGNKQGNGSKCSTNDNCSSGWCESGREGSITTGCKGTCKAKRENGQWCHNGDANSCKNSNQCTCGKCGNKQPNESTCSTNDNCSSGWCEGFNTLNCKGTCKAKRENGQWCHNGDANACKNSNQCTCGKCGNKQGNGNKCSTNDNCSSGWCQGSITTGCRGTCQAKRENGQWCHNGDANSCKTSNQCTCGRCGNKQGRGKRCATNDNCSSRRCGGWVTVGCRGTCK